MEAENIINTLLALVFVLALMGLIALLAKKMGLSQNGAFGKNKRLKVLESLPLDSKRRAVILQCDEKQHLVILSQNGDTVIETEIPVNDDANVKDAKLFE